MQVSLFNWILGLKNLYNYLCMENVCIYFIKTIWAILCFKSYPLLGLIKVLRNNNYVYLQALPLVPWISLKSTDLCSYSNDMLRENVINMYHKIKITSKVLLYNNSFINLSFKSIQMIYSRMVIFYRFTDCNTFQIIEKNNIIAITIIFTL